MPLVSVVMAVYNGEKYLAEAIDSILAQTYSNLELLIIDDGSNDRSAEIARAYERRESRIRLRRLARNEGPANARNHGIAAANGEFITPMDCDDICLPERLERQVAHLMAHPAIGAVGIGVTKVNADASRVIGVVQPETAHSLIVLGAVIGTGGIYSTFMFRRRSLLAVGGYEPGRRTGEDRELLFRLLNETSMRYANISDPLMFYRRHDNTIGNTRGSKGDALVTEVYERLLNHLGIEASAATLERFWGMRHGQKLPWLERRAAFRDAERLINDMIAAQWIDGRDKPELIIYLRRRLEQMTPRFWQKLCHWRRHRFGR